MEQTEKEFPQGILYAHPKVKAKLNWIRPNHDNIPVDKKKLINKYILGVLVLIKDL